MKTKTNRALLMVSLGLLTSCHVVNQLNDGVNGSTYAINAQHRSGRGKYTSDSRKRCAHPAK